MSILRKRLVEKHVRRCYNYLNIQFRNPGYLNEQVNRSNLICRAIEIVLEDFVGISRLERIDSKMTTFQEKITIRTSQLKREAALR